jgi:hypothetical protein
MNNFIRKYIQFSVKRHKLVILGAVLLLIAAFASAAPRVSIDASMEGMLPDDNMVFAAMEAMGEEFGARDDVFVVVLSDGSHDTVSSFLSTVANRIDAGGYALNIIYRIEIGENVSYFVSESGNLYMMTVTPDFENMFFLFPFKKFAIRLRFANISTTLSSPNCFPMKYPMLNDIVNPI